MSNLLVKHGRSLSPAKLLCREYAGTHTEKIVEAVRNAPLESREIIVVDDRSRDGVQPVLKKNLAL
jgi:hypothetical protein